VRVYLCLTQEHDLRLVALAALICILGSYTVMSLIQRAVAASGSGRLAWLSTGAFAAGGAIWATHFVAMLAYGPGMPTGLDPGLTALSLVVAIVVTGIGLAVAVGAGGSPGHWLGGAIVGLGIDAMHYTGMSALRVPALVGWDPFLVALSLLLAVAFGALSLRIALQRDDLVRRSLGAALLVVGICSLHFTAMGALALTPSPLMPLPHESVIPPVVLALAIGGIAIMLLGFSLAGSIVDQHLAHRSVREALRLQDLANATFEGIAIHSGGRLLDGNGALARLLGYPLTEMIGRDLSSFVAPEDRDRTDRQLASGAESAFEIRLLHADGSRVPVEIFGREMDYEGERVRVAAVRDMT
jgi:diguanylate cyclase